MSSVRSVSLALALGVLVWGGLIGGCAGQSDRPASQSDSAHKTAGGEMAGKATDASTGDKATPVSSETGGEPTEVKLVQVDRDGFDEVIRSHAGNVVLVDVWGSWCVPCREGFPHTVELARKYHDQGLRVVSLAIEFDPEKNRDKALAFLKEQQATFDNLISRYAFDEAAEAFNIEAGLPEYWVYGKDGSVFRRFTNVDPDKPIRPEDIEAAIREALGLPPAAG